MTWAVGVPLADGEHEAWLRVTTAGTLEVDLVEVVSGQEAVDAAHEDGALPESEDSLPNDVYVRNLQAEWVTVPVATDAELELHDCATGCELVAAAVEELLTGVVTPYGGTSALFALTVTGGEVASSLMSTSHDGVIRGTSSGCPAVGSSTRSVSRGG